MAPLNSCNVPTNLMPDNSFENAEDLITMPRAIARLNLHANQHKNRHFFSQSSEMLCL